ncbi:MULTISPECIES: diguanylate cyclase domain-containing protein [Rummeliibacillus]|uniref:diguanylate cyclase domain-containing protein n=1 Tax=Rummeliibacillus TaxID=648802 RepID=UPI00116B1804|nr:MULTISPECIES: diguanylate cyclase [Rummeliibacillus]MBB5170269.1 diguanylate cyclase (GGDEF)-like protein [Rummeliibacillus stabekisii]MCM3315450.1 GGDEF domain-containing protein [Rummeliibacillus stabekisii]GEL04529.1 hypothetical protein RST01_11560 [Rummeliibacillus stabekisii]
MQLKSKWLRELFGFGALFIILSQLPPYFLLNGENTRLLLYILLLLIFFFTLWRGLVAGLISSLIYLFITGTALIYTEFSGEAVSTTRMPLQLFLGYGIVLLLGVLAAGKIQGILVTQQEYNKRLQQDIKNFVAVDPETGFDNEMRMRLTLNEEMRRADRYHHTFTFILLKLENYSQFKKLYGMKEANNLWKQLALRITGKLRHIDKKFRYQQNEIGLLLTETSDASIDIIYQKLDDILKNHQLLNGKWITLQYKTSYITYTPNSERTLDELLGEMEREMRTSEL